MIQLSRLVPTFLMPMMLSGCFLLPGVFEADLKLMRGGAYEFSYVGEMQMLAPDDDMSPPKEFTFDEAYAQCRDEIDEDGTRRPYTFYDDYAARRGEAVAEEAGDDNSYVRRDCTPTELAELRDQQARAHQQRQKSYEEQSGMAAALFGGAIPGNDEALRDFAKTLAKYDGWDKVEYVGDNKFAVEYRASGTFDRYFAFPVLPDATTQIPFFHILPRENGALELASPALGGGQSNFAKLALLGAAQDKDAPDFSPIQGTVTVQTDGEILGNNAPDGYADKDGMRVMRWEVEGPGAGPQALIKLDR